MSAVAFFFALSQYDRVSTISRVTVSLSDTGHKSSRSYLKKKLSGSFWIMEEKAEG